MPFPVDQRFLSSVRLKKIVRTLASQLEMARPLIYINRTPLVNALDDEIWGRFTGQVVIADIIADSQRAVVHEAGKIELRTDVIPNIKVGQRVAQTTLNLMDRITSGYGRAEEEDRLFDWEQQFAENLVFGVRQRMNAICVAMMMDSDIAYNRLGIQLGNASWGMPSNLKVTTAVPWATSATATPIDDIFAMDQVSTDNYGFIFDQVIMSSIAFRQMVSTTEFANKASLPMQAHFLVPPAAISAKDRAASLNIAGSILNKEIVLDDATYNVRANDGTKTTARYLPTNKVILARRQDAGDPNVMDFANAVVTESIVARLSQSPMIDGFGGMDHGPVGYYTPEADNLNPPGIVGWAVCRGFARKWVPESTAVLTIG